MRTITFEVDVEGLTEDEHLLWLAGYGTRLLEADLHGALEGLTVGQIRSEF